MNIQRLLFAVAVAVSVTASSSQEQSQSSWTLRPNQFAVKSVFKGKPAPARVTQSYRDFRTRIREGAKQGPNFAGHYTIVQWGCGSGCLSFQLVDAVTGRVYGGAFGLLGLPSRGTQSGRFYEGLVFQLSSKLLIADGCPEDTGCGTYYLLWDGGRFKELRIEPQPEKKASTDTSPGP